MGGIAKVSVGRYGIGFWVGMIGGGLYGHRTSIIYAQLFQSKAGLSSGPIGAATLIHWLWSWLHNSSWVVDGKSCVRARVTQRDFMKTESCVKQAGNRQAISSVPNELKDGYHHPKNMS